MTANRYAVSIRIPRWDLEMGQSGYMSHVRDRLRRELGTGLIKVIEEEYKTPVVVDLRWQELTQDEYNYRLALVAYLRPTETMHVILPVVPEMEWSYYSYMGMKSSVVLEWGCGYCGQTNLVQDHLECRKCGAPRKPMQ